MLEYDPAGHAEQTEDPASRRAGCKLAAGLESLHVPYPVTVCIMIPNHGKLESTGWDVIVYWIDIEREPFSLSL